MRVLLDENLPHTLRHRLPNHEVVTAAYAGFAGMKNGQLLEAAEHAGFDVLLTGDRTLHYEQNLTGRRIAIVSLSAISWPLLEPNLDLIRSSIERAGVGSFVTVDCGIFKRTPKSF